MPIDPRANDSSAPPTNVAKDIGRLFSSRSNAPAYRIIRAQLIATVLATASCLFFDAVAAYSTLLGGLVCIVPAGFMAKRLDRPTSKARTALGHLVMAELGKLALTTALLIAIFVLVRPLNIVFFFGAIVGLHTFYIWVPLYESRVTDRTT
ncbi:MAG: ATP synthase subunit I [Pseudomonadales bacterium]|nr:ATP synthase subunit I [Pseudomonadales bacterium]